MSPAFAVPRGAAARTAILTKAIVAFVIGASQVIDGIVKMIAADGHGQRVWDAALQNSQPQVSNTPQFT